MKRKSPEPGVEDSRMSKTNAKQTFCLSDKDLEALTPKEVRNPVRPRGPSQKLFLDRELEELAVRKWGSPEGFQKERDSRAQKRTERASRRQGQQAESDPGSSDSDSHPEGEGDHNGAAAARSSTSEKRIGLDKFVEERIRRCRPDPASDTARGKCVLYWMRTAVRGHENPALDAAKQQARSAGVPLVVVAFVLSSHTHPTARRFKFWLEGLADAQAELQAQGLELWVFLEGHTQLGGGGTGVFQASAWGELMRLVNASSLVVTEDMPVSPYATWLQSLTEEADPHVRVWAVDTACVVPMRLSAKAHARAYTYRTHSQKPLQERLEGMPYCDAGTNWSALISRDWQALAPPAETAPQQGVQSAREAVGPLEWEPLDLGAEGCDIPALLAGCSGVDNSVQGIDHQIGGCSDGYKRWERFKAEGLSRYASRRNNAMIRDGVSRASAYHHYGMVSPFKYARDIHSHSSSGARRLADEFFTWRSVAYVYCFHRWPAIDTLEGLPAWSKATLQRHARDAREVYSRQQLEQGQTGDAFWDASQQQLASTGELHNNVRMSWGKALLPWTKDPAAALEEALHLNHRFALDGCDPCSYGGIGWCFGLFDGPKGPESTPVYGSLRTRPTSVMARRFNADAYRTLPLDGPCAEGSGQQTPAPRQRTLADCMRSSSHKKQASQPGPSQAGVQASTQGGSDHAPGGKDAQQQGSGALQHSFRPSAGASASKTGSRGTGTAAKTRASRTSAGLQDKGKGQAGIARFLKPVASSGSP